MIVHRMLAFQEGEEWIDGVTIHCVSEGLDELPRLDIAFESDPWRLLASWELEQFEDAFDEYLFGDGPADRIVELWTAYKRKRAQVAVAHLKELIDAPGDTLDADADGWRPPV
jgi:hypothetical protein